MRKSRTLHSGFSATMSLNLDCTDREYPMYCFKFVRAMYLYRLTSIECFVRYLNLWEGLLARLRYGVLS